MVETIYIEDETKRKPLILRRILPNKYKELMEQFVLILDGPLPLDNLYFLPIITMLIHI